MKRPPSIFLSILLVAGMPLSCERSSDGAPLAVRRVLGETGLSPGQFFYPRCLDADDGSLWVIDKAARVQRLDPDGRCTASWVMPMHDRGKPTGLSIAPFDRAAALYVADTHNSRVVIYQIPPAEFPRDREPAVLGSFGTYGTGPGQFIYPTDIAVLPAADGVSAERIYVSEYGGNDRISAFSRDGTFLFSFGEFGESADPDAIQFKRPQSIGIAGDELIVVDSSNHRLGRFTLEGRLLSWMGQPERPGLEPGHFIYPYGLALPGDGTALVSEFGAGRVQHVDLRRGVPIAAYGRLGRGEGELANPWGVAIVGREVFVLDSGHDRVVSFAAPREVRPEGGRS